MTIPVFVVITSKCGYMNKKTKKTQTPKNYFIDSVMVFPFMNGLIPTNIKTFSRKAKPVHFSDYSFSET